VIGTVVAAVVALGYLGYSRLTRVPEKPFVGPASASAPEFFDRTIEYGITMTHRQGDERLTGLDETLGSGACVLDYDGDGFVDLFMVNGSGDTRYYGQQQWWQTVPGHRLLRNEGGRRFVDVTADIGLEAATHGLGCVAADFDADTDPDLLITNVGDTLLLRNDGGSFTDVTASAGLAGSAWQTAAAVADVDGDGDLDLYVGGFIAFERGSRAYEPGSQFKQDAEAYFNSALFPALPNRLFENVGDLRFEDVTAGSGLEDSDGRTLAAIWSDVNDDGRPDLFVANAMGTGSTTGFLNRGGWRFEPMGVESRIEAGTSFRALAVGDVDNDGHAELVLTGAAGNQTAVLFRQNTADTTPLFVDRARQWGVANERYTAYSPWGAVLSDFNNDGWLDLMVGNGHIRPDSDTAHVTIGQAKQVWLNSGRRQFLEYVPVPRSPLLDHQSARGMVHADFNNDGNVDVYVAHNNDLGQLLINEPEQRGHWIGIKLMGDGVNTDAVGTRVAVTTAQGTQVKVVAKGSGFLSDSDPRVHFGLGALARVDVSVRWPDGRTTTYRDVDADTYVSISRRDGLRALDIAASPPTVAATSVGSDAIRVAYFEALARWQADQADPALLERLLAVLGDPSETARAAVVDALSERPSPAALGVLLRLFDDPSPSVVTNAVGAVCAYEDEAIVRFLLRMFAHESDAVRAATASCFERYFVGFEQLQAVIHRKYLALPHLVQALEDDSPAVKIASIRALAAAERFRGVPPLVELLKTSDGEVQASAVRAIGLIRDRYALPALLEFVQRQDLAAGSYAESFIALQRLGHEQLTSLLDEFAAGRDAYAGLGARTRMEALLAVARSPEGVVVPPREVLRSAAAVYRSAPLDAGMAVAYTELLVTARGADAAALTALSRHASPEVRAAAYVARFAIEAERRSAVVVAALADPDVSVRRAVLEHASSDPVQLPEAAALAAVRDEQTRIAAIRALRSTSSQAVAAQLADLARDSTADAATRVAAVQALDRSDRMFAPNEQWYATAPDDVLVTMLTCETRRLPAIVVARTAPDFLERYLDASSAAVRGAAYRFLLTREELWAKQAVVSLLEGDEDAPLRRSVLEQLPAGYLRDDVILARIAAERDDPLRVDALRLLYGTRTTESVALLRGVAADRNEDMPTRLVAAAALPADDRTALLATLR
jgi:HEAT repeat protein